MTRLKAIEFTLSKTVTIGNKSRSVIKRLDDAMSNHNLTRGKNVLSQFGQRHIVWINQFIMVSVKFTECHL